MNSLRGTRAYDELQRFVTEVGQVKQTVILRELFSVLAFATVRV